MSTKTFDHTQIDLKAAGPTGEFEAIVSTWHSQPDSQGDVIEKGAFLKSIARWEHSGAKMPVGYAHALHGDPGAVIGRANFMAETDEGLVLMGRLDIDSNPMALAVYERMKAGELKEFSIGYRLISSRSRKDGATILSEIDLKEVSVVYMGANAHTQLLALKSEPPATVHVPEGVDEWATRMQALYGADLVKDALGITEQEQKAHDAEWRQRIDDMSLMIMRNGGLPSEAERTMALMDEQKAWRERADRREAEVRAMLDRSEAAQERENEEFRAKLRTVYALDR